MSIFNWSLKPDEQKIVRDALQQYINRVLESPQKAMAEQLLLTLEVELLRRNGLSPIALDAKKGY